MAGKQKSRRTDWREQRRLQAWALFQRGWKQSKIAEAFDVTKQAVSVWIKRARSEGEDGLLSHPPPGAKPKLPRKVLQQLPELLLRGTESFGFRGNLWTTKRIAAVIEKSFLADGAAQRLHLERLPGYAPDLNPDEGVWNWLKNVEMKNQCLSDLDQLKRELRRAIERMRHKTDVIRSFLGLAKLKPIPSTN